MQKNSRYLLVHNLMSHSVFILFFCIRPEEYKKKVSEYVKKYASEEALRQSEQSSKDAGVSSSSESSMSEFSEDEAQVSKGPYLNDVYTEGGRGVNEMQT